MYPRETRTEFVSLSVSRDGPPVVLANPFDVKRSSAETEYFVHISKTGMTLWHFKVSKRLNCFVDDCRMCFGWKVGFASYQELHVKHNTLRVFESIILLAWYVPGDHFRVSGFGVLVRRQLSAS